MPSRVTPIEANHCQTGWELMVRFALWAHALGDVPDADSIRYRYGVSRATAYRWRAAYCAAVGLPTRPPRERRLTKAQMRRALRAAIRLRRAITEYERCRFCALYRQGVGFWGWCRASELHTRPSHICDQFKPSAAGDNRHPRLESDLRNPQ